MAQPDRFQGDRQIGDPRSELIRNFRGVTAIVAAQSHARLFSYTTVIPFAYAEVTQDGGNSWERVQVVGNYVKRRGEAPIWHYHLSRGETFIAYRETGSPD